MFQAYGALWIEELVFKEKYSFNTLITEFNYQIPDYTEH